MQEGRHVSSCVCFVTVHELAILFVEDHLKNQERSPSLKVFISFGTLSISLATCHGFSALIDLFFIILSKVIKITSTERMS